MGRPALSTTIIPAVCDHAGISSTQVREMDSLRVSVNSIRELMTQIDHATEVFGEHPTVGPFVRRMEDLFAPGTSEETRRDAGVFLVTEADLLVGHLSRSRVGWVKALPGDHDDPEAPPVLVTVTVNSAIEKALVRPDGQRENAYALLSTTTWRTLQYAEVARFLRDDRMARALPVFALIHEAIQNRPGAWYTYGEDLIDPHDVGDNWRAIIGSQNAAQDATKTKINTLAGIVRLARKNCWPLGERALPLGLRQPTTVNAAGQSEQVEDEPVKDEDGAAMATLILRGLSTKKPATTVGVEASVAGIRDGRGALAVLTIAPLLTEEQAKEVTTELVPTLSPEERKAVVRALDSRKGATKSQVDTARTAAIQVVRRVAQHVTFYKTGKMRWSHRASIEGRRDYSGRKPKFPVDDDAPAPSRIPDSQIVRVGDLPPDHAWHSKGEEWQAKARRTGFFDFEFEWSSPVELTPGEWQVVTDVCDEHPAWGRTRSALRARDLRKPCGPLSQLSWVQEDGTDQTMVSLTLDHDAYQVWRGPKPEDGQNWTDVRTPWFRIPVGRLHEKVGTMMVELGRRGDASPGPLPVLTDIQTAADPSPVELARTRLASLEAERDDLEEESTGLQRDKGNAPEGSREHRRITGMLRRNDARLDELDAEIAAAAAELDRAQDQLEREPTVEQPDVVVTVDGNPLLVVGGALQRLAGRDERLGPPVLARAVRWLLDGGSCLRFVEDRGRRVVMHVHVQLPSEDGPPATVNAGRIDLTRSDEGSKNTPSRLETLHDEAALRVLGEQAADRFVARTGWSRTFLVESLRDWLHQREVSFGAANALIDAALHEETWPAPSIVYGHLASEDIEAVGLAGPFVSNLVDPILHAYLQRGADWPQRGTGLIRTTLGTTRTLLTLLAAQPEGTGQRRAIAAELGLHNFRELRPLLSGQHLLGVAPTTYTRTNAKVLRCARDGCDGAPLTDVVAVPETLLAPEPGSVVCRRCHRPPGAYWDRRPLPDLYLRCWDATSPSVNAQTAPNITEARPARRSWPQLPRYLSVQAAATRLDLSRGSVEKLIRQRILPGQARDDDRGGCWVLEEDLQAPTVQRAADELRRPKPHQELTCRDCKRDWTRPARPGRPPARCPSCR